LLSVLLLIAPTGIGPLYGGKRVTRSRKIRATLSRIASSAANAGSFIMKEQAAGYCREGRHSNRAVPLLFGRLFGLPTSWGSSSSMPRLNWMPILLKEAGLSPQHATLISALFPLAGVGAVLWWIFDGSLQSELGYRGMLCVDRNQRVRNWPSRRKHWLADTDRVRRGCTHEHRAVVNARAGSRFLSDAGARHWSRVDARNRTVFGGIAGSFLVAELTRQHFNVLVASSRWLR